VTDELHAYMSCGILGRGLALSSHTASRQEVLPAPAEPTPTPAGPIKPAGRSKSDRWSVVEWLLDERISRLEEPFAEVDRSGLREALHSVVIDLSSTMSFLSV
jgi:hypothetical protein